MSKLGVHISSGNRRGFGDYLRRCAGAGSPVPVIFAVDQDVWPDVRQFSPQTVVIFRHQAGGGGGADGPGGMYQTDPVQAASDWMNLLLPTWAKNQAHYYAPINEQDPATLEGFKWLNDFTIECMQIAEANGFRLALYAFSAGNPKDVSAPAVGEPFKMEDAWRILTPSLQRAKANGHILLLHEYGLQFGTLRESTPYLALRYRRSYRYLAQFNADPPLVISEASAGAGFGGMNSQSWLADAQWYDSQLMKDRVTIGCCLYQLGGAENLVNMLPQLADYISKTPSPAPESSGAPVVLGPDTRPDGTPVPETVPIIPAPTPAPIPAPAPQPAPTPPEPAPQPTPPPAPAPQPPDKFKQLDFNVVVDHVRKNPDRPGQVIVTFRIEAEGGNGDYTYMCEGVALSGPTRDRPSARSGVIVEAYRVTSGDGQTVEKKFFFKARDFPPAT